MSSIIKVDTIQEKTSANGITVDGLNIKDSKLVTANSVVAANITADAIDATKIADNAISEEHLDVTAVTGHTAETSIADGDLVLIHDASASALRKMTKANFVAGVGGLSVADNWRLASSDVVDSSETDLDTGWEQVDSTGQGTVGSAMSQSSGVFTFPSTGIYHVQFTIHYRNEQAENYGRLIIAHKNGSTFTHLVDVRQLVQHSDTRQTITASTLFDVQNTSNDTVVFFGGSGQNNIEIYGNTGYNATAVTFLKVGAT